MKLSDYARIKGVTYRTAWNRFHAGKIEGAYMDETNHVVIPDESVFDVNRAAVYARVSSNDKRKTDLVQQEKRVQDWAVINGYQVVESVKEVGSGANDKRRLLTSLLKRDSWGTLIVEHKDRLTDSGFEWFRLFIKAQGRELVVINEVADGE